VTTGTRVAADRLPQTALLTWDGDLAARMVEGIRQYLVLRTAVVGDQRLRAWKPDVSSLTSWDRWLQPRRQRLARILGVGIDHRVRGEGLQIVSTPGATDGAIARGRGYDVYAIRWPVFGGLDGEGLLLLPHGRRRARMVVLPDAAQTPEQSAGLEPGLPRPQQLARRFAENGCAVAIPQAVDRDCEHSLLPDIRSTNMSHREFIYRTAYELGRHVLGYELESLFALLDGWQIDAPIGVAGYGEGGRLALYAAALDDRISAAGVSGAFGPREQTWREPIDRNLFGLLRQFGDAEVAAMIAPRRLVIEAARVPTVDGPPAEREGRSGAAPGVLVTPSFEQVAEEAERARRHVAGLRGASGYLEVVRPDRQHPGSDSFLRQILRAVGARQRLAPTARAPRRTGNQLPDPRRRRDRIVRQIIAHTQVALAAAEHRREQFWASADRTSATAFALSADRYRRRFARHVIGELPAPRGRLNPRSRLVYDTPKFRGYEVVLDVYGTGAAHVFSYGILLVPKGIRRGHQRPVVVCQHGLEGRPQDVADPAVDHDAYHTYACRLAEKGFVTFAPQNPYIGGSRYRDIQRLANPLGVSLFSVIVRQHERILQWLGSLPFVDAERIAFYGLSYGGKTAMRVPALLPGYCLSICSADYNEWIWKCSSTRHRWSYMGTGEYDMPEFDLGNTFNYAEMSWLIFPRPFMVERGHHDGVAPDEWVAYEYARTRRLYVLLGHAERTEIEFFDGPHTINGNGTFEFLERHLLRRESLAVS
jgi:dienelactone hydrolase